MLNWQPAAAQLVIKLLTAGFPQCSFVSRGGERRSTYETTMDFEHSELSIVIWDLHLCEGPGMVLLLVVGCSSHPSPPSPLCVGSRCYFEDAHIEELPQEDVSAQERSSASTSGRRNHMRPSGFQYAAQSTGRREGGV